MTLMRGFYVWTFFLLAIIVYVLTPAVYYLFHIPPESVNFSQITAPILLMCLGIYAEMRQPLSIGNAQASSAMLLKILLRVVLYGILAILAVVVMKLLLSGQITVGEALDAGFGKKF